MKRKSALTCIVLLSFLGACGTVGTQTTPATSSQATNVGTVRLSAAQTDRLKRVMIPLIRNMNHPIDKVQIALVDSKDINAANAGGGVFYVTLGLLEKADEDELRGVLAHEIAHQDLGHVAKTQALGTGLQIGSVLLDQIIPGAGTVAPVIADLGILRPFTRGEEYEADSHAVDILRRAGYNGKQIMEKTLTWILQTSGSSGGFFQTHPGTEDRVQRIRSLSG